MDHSIEHSPNGSSGHEQRDTGVGLIAASAGGLAIVVLAVFLLMWGTFNLLKNDQAKNDVSQYPMGRTTQIPPEPRLQEHPWEELQQLHAREQKVLSGYGWQDQKNGVLHIPIDRAIDLVAQKGLPYQQEGQPAAPAKTGAKPAVKPA